jgi:translation initiation factor 1 (eIF-1/SUI1)
LKNFEKLVENIYFHGKPKKTTGKHKDSLKQIEKPKESTDVHWKTKENLRKTYIFIETSKKTIGKRICSLKNIEKRKEHMHFH